MKTTTTQKTICFAYFADGKFIGWYADSFGSIRANSPKTYSYSEKQIEIVSKNFRHKLERGNTLSLDLKNPAANYLLNSSLDADSKMLSQYNTIELRVVECPEYYGKNPDFDEEDYKRKDAEREQKFKESGIADMPISMERFEAVKKFDEANHVECNNWIYPDSEKVREWAKNAPTEFLEIIKADKND